MPHPDDFFLNYRDLNLYHHLRLNLPRYKIQYDIFTPHDYFEVLAPGPICRLIAIIITNSKGERHVIFPWYVGKNVRKEINDLVSSCPKRTDYRFAPGTEADPEDYPVSP